MKRAIRDITILCGAVLLAFSTFAAPFSAKLLEGEVQIAFEGDSETLSLAHDFTATIKTVAPTSLSVALPDLDALRERFQGFSIAEGYGLADRALTDGRIERTTRWRLVADPAAERFRLAPFAVDVKDSLGRVRGSYATSPVLFPVRSLPSAEGSVEITPRKFFVMPTVRTVLNWLLRIFAVAVAIALGILLFRRLRRAVRLRQMTPSERAYAELDALLGRGLAARGLFKDYYVELTHVVRRYVERSYKIRAPRLTTEEFMEIAKKHPHFTPESLTYLSEFLHSADMVKFAGEAATVEIASDAADSARLYIERDSAAAKREAEMSNGGKHL